MIIPEIVLIQLSSWGWAHSCSKHVEDSDKHIIEKTVCQVGHLSELYEDAWSEKYLKILPEIVLIQLSSRGWAHGCLKHVEDSNKHIIKETVCQVGHLSELYEDAWSEKYLKILPEIVLIQLSSRGWAHGCLKHVEDSNKHIIEETVCQVGHLPELSEKGCNDQRCKLLAWIRGGGKKNLNLH